MVLRVEFIYMNQPLKFIAVGNTIFARRVWGQCPSATRLGGQNNSSSVMARSFLLLFLLLACCCFGFVQFIVIVLLVVQVCRSFGE